MGIELLEKVELPDYTADEQAFIERIEADLAVQLASKPRRLTHSLGVAGTAERMACLYDVDPFLARCAGILHDWDKALSSKELKRRARAYGIDMGVDLDLVMPLLHGIVAARELPDLYPELPAEVIRAIEVHTTAACPMSPLDEVIFVADGIEPNRPASPGIEKTRSLVGEVSLDDLFWESFVGGVVYVLEGDRYLYPGTINVYNDLLALRAHTD